MITTLVAISTIALPILTGLACFKLGTATAKLRNDIDESHAALERSQEDLRLAREHRKIVDELIGHIDTTRPDNQ